MGIYYKNKFYLMTVHNVIKYRKNILFCKYRYYYFFYKSSHIYNQVIRYVDINPFSSDFFYDM